MSFSDASILFRDADNLLERRKGGGGKGGGKSSGSKGASSGSIGKSTSSSTHTSSSKTVSTPHLLGGQSSAVTYSSGGGKTSKIASGAFKGRILGGGSRSGIYGTSVYGSGYPNRPLSSIGVAGLSFPYYYYPIVWEESSHTPSYPPYLNATGEYGHPSNNSRPGGVLMQTTLHSNTTGSTFHFLSDNSTAFALLPIIRANCSIHGNLNNGTSSTAPSAYISGNSSTPLAVDAVQYYRASSAVLTLEGYNNTVVLSNTPNATASSLPTDIDRTLLACLNATIGAAIPLVDAPAKFHISVAGYIFIVIAGLIGLVLLGIAALYVTVKCMDWKDGRSEKKSCKTLLVNFREVFQGVYSKKCVDYHSVSNPAQGILTEKMPYHGQTVPPPRFPCPVPSPASSPVYPPGLNATYYDLGRRSPSVT